MKEQTVILHIGLMKTGSTYLQHSIFPELPITFLNNFNELGLHYDLNQPILISNEGIAGNPYKTKLSNSMFEHFKNSILSLNSMFKSPKIIFCVREPSSFILSTYKQYLHEGGTFPFEKFYSQENDSLVIYEDFYFSKYVDFIFKHFDSKQIFIYDFDEFKNDKKEFLSRLIRFISEKRVIDYDKILSKRKANPSVPMVYEKGLIFGNKVNKWLLKNTGLRLQVRVFGKVLNTRVFFQYVLTRIYRPTKERDISNIKELYNDDWLKVKKLIRNMRNQKPH